MRKEGSQVKVFIFLSLAWKLRFLSRNIHWYKLRSWIVAYGMKRGLFTFPSFTLIYVPSAFQCVPVGGIRHLEWHSTRAHALQQWRIAQQTEDRQRLYRVVVCFSCIHLLQVISIEVVLWFLLSYEWSPSWKFPACRARFTNFFCRFSWF